jgi:hypothetical protein
MAVRNPAETSASRRAGFRVCAALLAVAVAMLTLGASSALATFHLMSIREVYTGFAGDPNVEYVELQMYSGGQGLVKDHRISTVDAAGNLVKANPFPGDAPNSVNQSTILMATPEAEAKFGLIADGALSPSGQLEPGGGAVCWEEIDCVTWGSVSDSPLSPSGPPFSGAIPDGMALRRTISPSCPTLLDANDDSDSSALDFSPVFPAPRPNSVAPSERACPSNTGEAGGGPDGDPPQTKLRRKPLKRGRDRTPTFGFASDESGATFQCKLDRRPFRSCRSPFTAPRLSPGRHTFRVRARDRSGELDPSPAFYAFKIVTPHR